MPSRSGSGSGSGHTSHSATRDRQDEPSETPCAQLIIPVHMSAGTKPVLRLMSKQFTRRSCSAPGLASCAFHCTRLCETMTPLSMNDGTTCFDGRSMCTVLSVSRLTVSVMTLSKSMYCNNPASGSATQTEPALDKKR